MTKAFNEAAPNKSVLAGEMKEAFRKKDWAAIPGLIERGANIDQTDENGNTALIVTAIYGDLALARFLVAHDASLDAVNNYDNSAMTLAISNGFTEIVRVLVEAGAAVTETHLKRTAGDSTNGIGPLLRAAPEIRRQVEEKSAEAVAAREWAVHDANAAQQEMLKNIAARKKLNIKRGPQP